MNYMLGVMFCVSALGALFSGDTNIMMLWAYNWFVSVVLFNCVKAPV